MAKVVLTHKPASVYDDELTSRYHFPRQYLRTVEAAIGDLVVYYEPGRRGTGDRNRSGRSAYFATAQIVEVEADPRKPDHFYAYTQHYLPFEHPVPFREPDGTYERRLQKPDGTTNRGLFGVSVRRIADDEFAAIWAAGFRASLDATQPDAQPATSFGLMDAATPYLGPDSIDRRLVDRLVTRPFRDAAFQSAIQNAYVQTCAFTGLKVINGGGRPEVEAAHIRPVASNGPDSVRNGLAVSRTVHWLFDRGLVSIADDLSILVTSDLPAPALRLLNADRRLLAPSDPALRPATTFLDWHRTNVFKG